MKHKVCSKLWTDINVRIPTKQILNCCKRMQYSEPTIDEINELGTDIFHRRTENLADKKLFIENNELNSACGYCKESWPNSIWNSWNRWKDRDWTQDELDQLIDQDYTNYIEIMLGNTCNMSCMYCDERSSSTWADIKKTAKVNNDAWKQAIMENLYAYIEQQDLNTAIPNLMNNHKMFYNFLGGEPLLDWEIFDVLERILAIHRKKGESGHAVSITSNLNIKPKLLERFMKLVDDSSDFSWIVSASIDAPGEYGENIRDGLSWDLFEQNSKTLLLADNISCVSFLPTISSLSIPKHPELVSWILNIVEENNIPDNKWDIGVNAVDYPQALSPKILPKDYVKYIDEAIDIIQPKYPDNYHINWLLDVRTQIGERRSLEDLQKAKKWFILQGQLKNKDYFEIFPMLKDIL